MIHISIIMIMEIMKNPYPTCLFLNLLELFYLKKHHISVLVFIYVYIVIYISTSCLIEWSLCFHIVPLIFSLNVQFFKQTALLYEIFFFKFDCNKTKKLSRNNKKITAAHKNRSVSRYKAESFTLFRQCYAS